MIWALATKTQGFKADKLSTADRNSLGTQFPLKAVDTSSACGRPVSNSGTRKSVAAME